jgi:hypothetical protein
MPSPTWGHPSTTGSSSSTSFTTSTIASSISGSSSDATHRSRTFLKSVMIFCRRSTWIPLGRLLLLRRSTLVLRLRLLSYNLLRYPDRLTGTTTRTRTTAAMATTAARTTAVVVVTLATPPRPPLAPSAHRHLPRPGTHGTAVSAGLPGRTGPLHAPRDSCPDSSSHCTNRLPYSFSRLDILE